MPTAARFIAAMFMALAGVIVIMVVVNTHDNIPSLARDSTSMSIVVGILGFMMGWWGMGKKIGGKTSAAALGLRAGISMYIWACLFFGFWYMVQGILDHAYYQPLSAIKSMLSAAISYSKYAWNVPVMGTIIVLSLIVGRITKNAWLKWDQSTDLTIDR